MQAKEILSTIKSKMALLNIYKVEIKTLDLMIGKINGIDSLASTGGRMTEFRDNLLKDAESVISVAEMALNLVNSLEDTRQKDLIVSHYFQGKPISQIALEMGLSRWKADQLHTAALEQLDLMLMNEGATS